ncbi:hypothetical protein EK21DRAFT_111561 [Setomelanomma holmii]|uniref:Uncharacterized protein n=1 Tax=Setomelanomma holmii TaxID=210430 RepID=A0A9P4HBY2_9PLEO|nr:hypothetical protein EK21DRAFT_111561 [Setomelanomma holmii]
MVSTPTRNRGGNAIDSPGGGVFLGGSVGSSPQATSEAARVQRRQTLREGSAIDFPNWHVRAEPIATPAMRHSNTMVTQSGGPVNFGGIALGPAEGYGTSASSSSAQGHCGRAASTQESPGVSTPTAPFPAFQTSGIDAFLAAVPTTIDIAAERGVRNANPSYPSFLHGVVFNPADADEWYNQVLPALRSTKFIFTSTADLHYAATLFSSSEIPDIYKSVTKIALPKFYWFSGVAHNRRHNPYLAILTSLPNLEQLSITLHTAGLTTSCFGERQMINLEASDPVRAKERKVMALADVVAKYELNGFFACKGLRRVKVEWVDCEMTLFFTKVGRASDLLSDLLAYLISGFAAHSMSVFVEMERLG